MTSLVQGKAPPPACSIPQLAAATDGNGGRSDAPLNTGLDISPFDFTFNSFFSLCRLLIANVLEDSHGHQRRSNGVSFRFRVQLSRSDSDRQHRYLRLSDVSAFFAIKHGLFDSQSISRRCDVSFNRDSNVLRRAKRLVSAKQFLCYYLRMNSQTNRVMQNIQLNSETNLTRWPSSGFAFLSFFSPLSFFFFRHLGWTQ